MLNLWGEVEASTAAGFLSGVAALEGKEGKSL
jgi:hypothetical protein